MKRRVLALTVLVSFPDCSRNETTVVQHLIVWELTTLLCRDQMLEDLKSKCVSWRHCKNVCHAPDACDLAGLEVGFLNFRS